MVILGRQPRLTEVSPSPLPNPVKRPPPPPPQNNNNNKNTCFHVKYSLLHVKLLSRVLQFHRYLTRRRLRGDFWQNVTPSRVTASLSWAGNCTRTAGSLCTTTRSKRKHNGYLRDHQPTKQQAVNCAPFYTKHRERRGKRLVAQHIAHRNPIHQTTETWTKAGFPQMLALFDQKKKKRKKKPNNKKLKYAHFIRKKQRSTLTKQQQQKPHTHTHTKGEGSPSDHSDAHNRHTQDKRSKYKRLKRTLILMTIQKVRQLDDDKWKYNTYPVTSCHCLECLEENWHGSQSFTKSSL